MSRDLKNIDQLFYDNLDGAAEQPPVHVWDGIENALDKIEAVIQINKKEKRKRYAIAFLLCMIAGASYFFWNMSDKNNETKKQSVVSVNNNPVSEEIVSESGSMKKDAHKLEGNNKEENIISKEVSVNNNTSVNQSQPVIAAVLQKTSGHVSIDQLKNMIDDQQQVPVSNIDPVLVNDNTNNLADVMTMPVIEHQPLEKEITVRSGFAQELVYGNKQNSLLSPVSTNKLPQLIKTKREGKLSFTVFYAPDITTRNLEQNFVSTLGDKKEEILRTEKNGALDFTIGTRLEYKLGKHFSLQSGVSFSTNTIDIAPKTVYARVDNKDGALKYRFSLSSGYAFFKPRKIPPPQFVGDSAQSLSSVSTLHYVSIPLLLKYNYPVGRFNFSLQAGITARFITKQSIAAVYAFNGDNEKSTSNEIQGLKTSYFNGNVGVGADYALNRHVSLTVFPSFNFATTSINRDAPVKAYPNTLSIAGGLKFNL